MMRTPRRDEVRARTPSSAMLVQMLFVMGAVGTGAIGALVTWLGPRRGEATKAAPPAGDAADEQGERAKRSAADGEP